MLKKNERLTTAEFDHFFKSGKRFHTEYFTLVFTPLPHTFHCAVVVGKKVYQRAVDRNRLRRQLYNRVYHLHRTTDLTGVYILLTKPAIKNRSVEQVWPEMMTSILKANQNKVK